MYVKWFGTGYQLVEIHQIAMKKFAFVTTLSHDKSLPTKWASLPSSCYAEKTFKDEWDGKVEENGN